MRKDKEKKLTFTEIAKGLKNIISEVSNVPISSIKDSTDLQKHLGIDSFNATEILVAVEQKYGIRIDPAETFNLRTFKDVLKLAKKHLRK